MKKFALLFVMMLLLTSCSSKEALKISFTDYVPLLKGSQITQEDFTVYIAKDGSETPVTDFKISKKTADNIDSVTITYGEISTDVPVKLFDADNYIAEYNGAVYDSSAITKDDVTIYAEFCEGHKKIIPKNRIKNFKATDNESEFNITFDVNDETFECKLLKSNVEKILCADLVCPNEKVSKQDISFYAVYSDGHTGPLNEKYIEINDSIKSIKGEKFIEVKYRNQKYVVSVLVADYEIHPLVFEIADGKKTLDEKGTEPEHICFIGDSRLCGLDSSVRSDAFYIHRTARSIYWLKSEGEDRFSQVRDYSDTVIIFMGINDLYHPKVYREYLNEFAEKYSDKRVIFLSLGPVDEENERKHGYSVKNSEIEEFNETVQENLSDKVEFIDYYSMLKRRGFTTSDGVHYLKNDYVRIYNYILERISNE